MIDPRGLRGFRPERRQTNDADETAGNTKSKIKTMQAFVDGEDIEILMHNPDGTTFWLKELMPSWNWDKCSYRVSSTVLPTGGTK